MWAAAAAGASVNVFTTCSGHAAQVDVSAERHPQQVSRGAAASQQRHAYMQQSASASAGFTPPQLASVCVQHVVLTEPKAVSDSMHTFSIPLASCLASAAGNLAAMQAMILSSWGPWVS